MIIFSDGCIYQNKNVTLANSISDFCVRRNISVEHKYLIKGHTHMEVDSCHSLIERALRGITINVPYDYINIFLKARKNPKPFKVNYLDHTFFKDYSKLGPYQSIRPGRGKGDPHVTHIRCLCYSPDGVIRYKLSVDEDWNIVPKTKTYDLRTTGTVVTLTPLFTGRLKIPESKFKHLKELKEYIPKDHHPFYDSLLH